MNNLIKVLAIVCILAIASECSQPCTLAGFYAAVSAGGQQTMTCTTPTVILIDQQTSGTYYLSANFLNLTAPNLILGTTSAVTFFEVDYTAEFHDITFSTISKLLVRGTLNCFRCKFQSYGNIQVLGSLNLYQSLVTGCSDSLNCGYVSSGGSLTSVDTTFTSWPLTSTTAGLWQIMTSTATFQHCTIVGFSQSFSYGYSSNIHLYGNILDGSFYGYDTTGISNINGAYNIFTGGAPSYFQATVSGSNQFNVPLSKIIGPIGNYSADGLSIESYPLLSCSPAINGAINDGSAGNYDQNMNPRVQKGYPDIGAFESSFTICVGFNPINSSIIVNNNNPRIGLRVQLSGPSISPLNVFYSTSDITAIAGTDYVQAGGILNFVYPNVVSVITINIIGNTSSTSSKVFGVYLSNCDTTISSNATVYITYPPVTTAPLTTQPLTTNPLTTQPLTTQPLTTQPLTTQPLTTQSLTTNSLTTQSLTSSSLTSSAVTSGFTYDSCVYTNPNTGVVFNTHLLTGHLYTWTYYTINPCGDAGCGQTVCQFGIPCGNYNDSTWSSSGNDAVQAVGDGATEPGSCPGPRYTYITYHCDPNVVGYGSVTDESEGWCYYLFTITLNCTAIFG